MAFSPPRGFCIEPSAINDARCAALRVRQIYGVTSVFAARSSIAGDFLLGDHYYCGDPEARPFLDQMMRLLHHAVALDRNPVFAQLRSHGRTIYGAWQRHDPYLCRIAVAFPAGAPATKSLGRALGRAWATK